MEKHGRFLPAEENMCMCVRASVTVLKVQFVLQCERRGVKYQKDLLDPNRSQYVSRSQ